VYGVFAAKAPHLSTAADMEKLTPLSEMLIDTGYTKEELEELCPLGTPVGFKPIYADLLNDRLAGKAFDDKACGACAIFGIDAVQRRDLAGDVYFLFSAFEETGMTGARVAGFGLRPDYALVLDVTHASVPEAKDRYLPEFGSGVAVAASPITNRRLTRMVTDLCKNGNIPFTVDACPGSTGTNANVLGVSAEGIPTALCSLPLKSMHTSAEVLSLDDARALSRVVSAFIKSKEISEVFGR
jgi:endoglucanase